MWRSYLEPRLGAGLVGGMLLAVSLRADGDHVGLHVARLCRDRFGCMAGWRMLPSAAPAIVQAPLVQVSARHMPAMAMALHRLRMMQRDVEPWDADETQEAGPGILDSLRGSWAVAVGLDWLEAGSAAGVPEPLHIRPAAGTPEHSLSAGSAPGTPEGAGGMEDRLITPPGTPEHSPSAGSAPGTPEGAGGKDGWLIKVLDRWRASTPAGTPEHLSAGCADRMPLLPGLGRAVVPGGGWPWTAQLRAAAPDAESMNGTASPCRRPSHRGPDGMSVDDGPDAAPTSATLSASPDCECLDDGYSRDPCDAAAAGEGPATVDGSWDAPPTSTPLRASPDGECLSDGCATDPRDAAAAAEGGPATLDATRDAPPTSTPLRASPDGECLSDAAAAEDGPATSGTSRGPAPTQDGTPARAVLKRGLSAESAAAGSTPAPLRVATAPTSVEKEVANLRATAAAAPKRGPSADGAVADPSAKRARATSPQQAAQAPAGAWDKAAVISVPQLSETWEKHIQDLQPVLLERWHAPNEDAGGRESAIDWARKIARPKGTTKDGLTQVWAQIERRNTRVGQVLWVCLKLKVHVGTVQLLSVQTSESIVEVYAVAFEAMALCADQMTTTQVLTKGRAAYQDLFKSATKWINLMLEDKAKKL